MVPFLRNANTRRTRYPKTMPTPAPQLGNPCVWGTRNINNSRNSMKSWMHAVHNINSFAQLP